MSEQTPTPADMARQLRKQEDFLGKLLSGDALRQTRYTRVVMLEAAAMLDALSAQPGQPAAVPEGWKLVPVEPTEDMEAAGWIDKEDVCPCDIYRAMLSAAPPAPVQGDGWSGVVAEIAAERRRQIEEEVWLPGHDDEEHRDGSLALAGAAYAISGAGDRDIYQNGRPESLAGLVWPWAGAWWKPKDRRRDLIRAAALIVAEVERLDRASARPLSEGSDRLKAALDAVGPKPRPKEG